MNNEIAALQTKNDYLGNESENLKMDNDNLLDDLNKALEQIEKESIEHVTEETKAHILKEKLDFLKLLWELVLVFCFIKLYWAFF